MELRQLHTFREVAHTASFSRAALNLDYAQSSISSQMHALEDELGVHLFDRLGRKTVLTDAGERMLGYAEKILDLANEAQQVVPSNGETTGTLTISAPESVCTYHLPAVLEQFRAQFPRVELIFSPMLTVADWEGVLRDGRADAALILDEPKHAPYFQVEMLRAETILLVTAPSHPLAQQPFVKPEDMRDQTLLLTEAGCSYRATFDRSLYQARVRPSAVLEFHSVEAIKQCAMADMGIALLPEVALKSELAAGRLVVLPWHGPAFEFTTMLAWHKDKWLSPALNAFLNVTRDVLGA